MWKAEFYRRTGQVIKFLNFDLDTGGSFGFSSSHRLFLLSSLRGFYIIKKLNRIKPKLNFWSKQIKTFLFIYFEDTSNALRKKISFVFEV